MVVDITTDGGDGDFIVTIIEISRKKCFIRAYVQQWSKWIIMFSVLCNLARSAFTC